MDADTLLSVENLRTYFQQREGDVRSVDGVSFRVPRGKTVCLVGESGCGKSVTARSVLGLVEPPGRIMGGNIWWRGKGREKPVDLASLNNRGEEFRKMRGSEIAMVFQEPMASLSPMYTVGDHLIEAILLHLPVTKNEATRQAIGLLERVGIPRAAERMSAYPFQLSGGMCQRVMIAIALACSPALLIADEPTTALDVTTQARILDLLNELKSENGMSMLFITHDLGVVAEVADEVVVMYLGTVVEHGEVNAIFDNPKHPYTRALLSSVSTFGLEGRRDPPISGEVPSPLKRPSGCPFHPRCPEAIQGVCEVRVPPDVPAGNSLVRCVLYEDSPTNQPAMGSG